MGMERSVRLRLVLAAPVLAALYFYLLIFSIGWTSALYWPSWWFGVFSSRHVAAITWMVVLHTIGVFLAAAPIAFAAVIIRCREAVFLGAIVGLLATIPAVLPSLSSHILPIVWNSHPVYFVTDQIKLLVAVPFATWLIRKLSARNGAPMTPSAVVN
jgi:hypothetical protein